jgi:hypothetical protein
MENLTKNKILELIPLLDKNEDSFLILMLKLKTKKIEEFVASKVSVTHKEKEYAKTLCRSAVRAAIKDYGLKQKLVDAGNMLSRVSNCDNCKHAIEGSLIMSGKTYTTYSDNPDSQVCKNCERKSALICGKISEVESYLAKQYDYVTRNAITDEVIKMKSIIVKLNQKLKDYDASKH